MILQNVLIFMPDKSFGPGSVVIENDRILSICPPDYFSEGETILDGKGAYCLPGFIDLHFHGCLGADVCDGTEEALKTIAEYEASLGVTTICPATMTLPVKELKDILANAAGYARTDHPKGAHLAGLNMEGPFISRSKKGAQDASYILDRNGELACDFFRVSEGLVRFLGIAPEMPGEDIASLAAKLPKNMKLSLAHTDASYEEAKQALDAGACHGVHLFNGMSPFHHRDPGVVGALAESPRATVEMICDGIHLHPAAVRLMYRLFGGDRIILVSDSMRATGLSDGIYTLGGQEVRVKGREAALTENGALAGSVTPLPDCVRQAVTMGIALEDAIWSATAVPAKALGIQEECGFLEEGKRADLVLWNQDLSLQKVILRGKIL